jgi:hypothetical protein
MELSESVSPEISIFISEIHDRRFEPEMRVAIAQAEAMRLEPDLTLVPARLEQLRQSLPAIERV